MKPVNVCFSTTGYGPLWAPAVRSWLNVVAYTSRQFTVKQEGKIGGSGVTDRTYTMSAQNALVKQMLSDETFTHLFMTESDMILPYDCIVRLMALDKDIASGVYFLRAPNQWDRGTPCLWKKSDQENVKKCYSRKILPYYHSPIHTYPQGHPFRVDACGLGCVLFRREVFTERGLENPWFDMKAGIEDNIGYGSDVYFYTKARLAGIETWVDPNVQCKQIDYYETDIEDYRWQIENNPEFLKTGFIVGDTKVQS